MSDLKEFICKQIENIKNGKIVENMTGYSDFKTKYAVLKPSVIVEISLTEGKVIKLDITDYFKEEIK